MVLFYHIIEKTTTLNYTETITISQPAQGGGNRPERKVHV